MTKIHRLHAVSTQPATPEGARFEDCLSFGASFAGRPMSAASLSAGLPTGEDGLEERAFAQAAERAGLELDPFPASATLEGLRERRHEDGHARPSGVLLLRRSLGRYALVTNWLEEEAGIYLVIPDGSRGSYHAIDCAELASLIRGGGFVLRARRRPCISGHEPPPERSYCRSLWRTLSGRHRLQLASETVAINFLAAFTALCAIAVFDYVLPTRAFEALWVISAGVLSACMIDFGLGTMRARTLDAADMQFVHEADGNVFGHAIEMPMTFQPKSTGEFATAVHEGSTVRDFPTSRAITALIDLPFSFLFVAVIALIGGWLAIVPLAALAAFGMLPLRLLTPLSQAVHTAMQAASRQQGLLIESLAGRESLKIARAENAFRRRWNLFSREAIEAGARAKRLGDACSGAARLTRSTTTTLMAVAGIYLIAGNHLTLGSLIACLLLAGRALAPLEELARLATRLQQIRIEADTQEKILARPSERTPGVASLLQPEATGELEFRNVTFAYPNAAAPALQGVSFALRAGERVAIIGGSGAGKSTIAKLALGLHAPQEGAVLVGGRDIRRLDPHLLRQTFCALAQDAILFSGSVRDNIACGSNSSDDARIARAAEATGANAFIRQHPLRYDMPVGERGQFLAAGQRQAIALARALTAEGPIVLLDEPMNSLDHASETKLHERLRHPERTETLILITHRMHLLDLVDRVIVMHDGRIALDGPKQTVLDILKGRTDEQRSTASKRAGPPEQSDAAGNIAATVAGIG